MHKKSRIQNFIYTYYIQRKKFYLKNKERKWNQKNLFNDLMKCLYEKAKDETKIIWIPHKIVKEIEIKRWNKDRRNLPTRKQTKSHNQSDGRTYS